MGRVVAADGALEERVGGERVGAVDEEDELAGAVALGAEHLDPQVAELEHVALVDHAVDLRVLGRLRAAEHRGGEVLDVVLEALDVIGVAVRHEHGVDGEAERLGLVDQRLHDAVAVDEDPVAALAVGDEVAVGGPAGSLGAFDDEGHASSSTERMPS